MAALTIRTNLTHPAMLAGLPTPPATPLTPMKSYPIKPRPAPVPDYALLRSHHVQALNYVIAKLRWEQSHNDYIRGEDAWWNHIRMINLLETELKAVKEAQIGLDQFTNCFAPMAFPKPHGPQSESQYLDEKKKAEAKEKELNARLDTQFPFIKQLFIGPMTKQQARYDKQLRENLVDGDFEDLSVLLPSENYRMLMAGEMRKAAGGGGGAGAGPKKPYQEVRMDKEKAKVKEMLAESPAAAGEEKAAALLVFGPMTKEEWIATLPVAGPMTKHEALLMQQREQRHMILTYLRKPWPVYDEDAGDLMAKLGRLAVKKLNHDVAKSKAAEKAKTEKAKTEQKE